MTAPTIVRSLSSAVFAALLFGAAPAARAQATYTATIRTTVSVAVPRVAGVVAVAAPRVRAHRRSQLDVAATVIVKANTPYTLVAWLPGAALARTGVRVMVRDAHGLFRELRGAEQVAVVERGAPGARRQSEIVYRVEAGDASALSNAAVALRYDAIPERAPVPSANVVTAGGGF
jgi:hypothetical protein